MTKSKSAIKLKFINADRPTGRYRSFENRAMPSANVDHNGFWATVTIRCPEVDNFLNRKDLEGRTMKIGFIFSAIDDEGKKFTARRVSTESFTEFKALQEAANKIINALYEDFISRQS